jgi:microcompartment protein CcmK/EutM
MILCRVTGTVVSTVKSDRLRASRLLLVRPLALDGTLADRPEDVALDPGLDAGVGDTVLIAKEGAVVADLFDRDLADGALATPANVVIVAVVEGWTVGTAEYTAR